MAPTPPGSYAIGSVADQTDATGVEIYSVDPNNKRELMAQIWYPAGRNQSSDQQAGEALGVTGD